MMIHSVEIRKLLDFIFNTLAKKLMMIFL